MVETAVTPAVTSAELAPDQDGLRGLERHLGDRSLGDQRPVRHPDRLDPTTAFAFARAWPLEVSQI